MTSSLQRAVLVALVTEVACHSGPDAETPRSNEAAKCQAMSREELDAVARAPRIRDRLDAARKIDHTLWKAVRTVELAAEGRPWSIRIPKFPAGCVPAFVEVLIVHTGNGDEAEQAMIALGLHASFTRGNPYSFAVGYISPARVADLASLPFVVSMSGADPVPSLE